MSLVLIWHRIIKTIMTLPIGRYTLKTEFFLLMNNHIKFLKRENLWTINTLSTWLISPKIIKSMLGSRKIQVLAQVCHKTFKTQSEIPLFKSHLSDKLTNRKIKFARSCLRCDLKLQRRLPITRATTLLCKESKTIFSSWKNWRTRKRKLPFKW